MLVRRVSTVIIAALLGGLMLAGPAQALIVDDGGGGGGGGGPIPAPITFDDQHGTTQTIDAVVGDKMYPWSASWEGSTFTGWWTAPTGGTLLPTPIVVTGTATVYAQWTLNSYTVTFQPANGAAPSTRTADYETTISAPNQPSRASYTFAGWFTAASGGAQVTFPYTVTGDTTLYAHWTGSSYAITLDTQDGAAALTYDIAANTGMWAYDATRAGYIFAGWWTAPIGGTQITFPYLATSDATLYAQWTPIWYSVTFEPGNGGAASVSTATTGTSIPAPSTPTRWHYQFAGWFTASTGGTEATFPYTTSGDATFYAQWTPEKYTVTFQPGNGGVAANQQADYDTKVSAPVEPTRTGYAFDGWFTAATGGLLAPFPYTVTGDVTLYAQWIPLHYTWTVDPQNGTAPLVNVAAFGVLIGPGEPSYLGHTFTGWWTAPTGGTQFVLPYTVTGDVTLYAQWTLNQYTVTFEPGNGDAASNSVAELGSTVSGPSQPNRAGYTFTGWFTAASGGTEVNLPYTVSGDATLYAQWTIDTHTVTFEPGNGGPATEVPADFDTTIPAPAEPSRPSHEFTGWFTAASGGTEVTFPYTVTGDITLYAQWERLAASFTAPSQAAPGATIPVTGENFLPGESVEIWLLSTPVKLATVIVGADGTFSTTVVIPASTPAGDHHIELRGAATVTLSSPVTVSAVLASTGAEIGGAAGLAALLMLGGLALVLRKRRAA